MAKQPSLFDDLDTMPAHCVSPAFDLDAVRENAGQPWQDQATDVLRSLSGEVTGEDVRLECARRGIVPHHHNAWGSLVAYWVREGLLVPTGRYRAMRGTKAHGRETKVYCIGARS